MSELLRFSDHLRQRIHACGTIAVLVIDDARHAVNTAHALLAGGVDVMELTLRTAAAIDALGHIRAEVPEMLAGIGTVLNPTQIAEVHQAGAQFAVAPGTNPRVLEAAASRGLPFAPGVVTPSDLEVALEFGCREVKFFPAEPSGGLKYLKSLAAPYAHLGVRYIPLGGIGPENLGQYLADPSVLAVGGSWLATRELIRDENWPMITRLAQQAKDIAERSKTKLHDDVNQ